MYQSYDYLAYCSEYNSQYVIEKREEMPVLLRATLAVKANITFSGYTAVCGCASWDCA